MGRPYDPWLGIQEYWEGFTITATPSEPGQYVQRKYIIANEPTPQRVFFEMGLVPVKEASTINLNVQSQGGDK